MKQIGVWHSYEVEDTDRVDIGKEYGLHDLQLRALDSRHRMPQAIESDEWLVVTFLVPFMARGVVTSSRLSVLVSRTQVVTMHTPGDKAVETIMERIELTPKITLSPTGVLGVVADAVTEQFSPIIDYIDDAIDSIEDVMISRPTDKQLRQLFHYKKRLVELRRVVLPTTALLDALSDGRYKLVEHKYSMYLRDSYSYSWRTHELIDTLRDLLTSALDTYLSVVSNRMNDVMKRLTMVATIFMPISFIVGFGGMNFVDQIPFGSSIFFGFILFCIVATPLFMLTYYRKKKWF